MNIYRLISIATILCLCVNGITGYTVSGTKILDPTGKQVMLKGVNRPSFEWSATGQYASLADYTLMADMWGANVVRLPTNQDFWLNGTAASTAAYQAQIAQQVAWITSLGMGVIIDLHWNNGGQQMMADRNSITYWSEVAAVYKNNPWVMFELYNEPHDITWDQWLSGDSTWAGMQEMYNAVRAAGASNMCVVGGLNWAFDLSGVGNGYAVTGTNIAYATHPYDYAGKQAADWPGAFGYLAPTYPVIMTEYGQYCNNDTYVSDLLAYAQSNGFHWTAWAWFVSGCAFPSIIADWTGTPISGVGILVKEALAGSVPTASPSSSTSTSTTAPSGGSTPAAGSLNVYSGALGAGWQDWSWASPYSLASTTYVMSGSTASIMFSLQSYGGIYYHTEFPFSVGSYNTVQFYVNGGTNAVPASSLSVQVYGTGTTPAVVGSAAPFPASVPVSQWSLISIPISAFGLSSSTQVSGIAIKSNVATSAVVYVTNINFVPSGTPASTQAPTAAPTTAPTTKPTAAPTTAPTAAPTTKPTAAPTTAPTTKPTVAPTTAPTTKPTAAPTTKPTVAPTTAPTTKPTSAPTSAPTTKPTAAPTTQPSSGCDSSNVQMTQTTAGSWSSNNEVVTQYNLAISHTCAGKTLVGLTLTASNWNPVSFWNIDVVSSSNGQTVLSLPSYIATSTLPFQVGYQNVGGQANFAISSVTFQ